MHPEGQKLLDALHEGKITIDDFLIRGQLRCTKSEKSKNA